MISNTSINQNLIPFVIDHILQQTNSQGKIIVTVTTHPVKRASSTGIRPLLRLGGVPLPELKYFDLIAEEQFSNGIYILFKDENPYYIGKCSSRAIVDRIGSHMDLRQSGVINCMVKRTAQQVLNPQSNRNLSSFSSSEIENAALPVLLSLKLFYIPLVNNPHIEDVEKSLIAELQPTLQKGYSKTLAKRYELITIQ